MTLINSEKAIRLRNSYHAADASLGAFISSIAADEVARPQTTMFGQPIKGFSDEAGRISSKLDAFLDEMALSGLIDPSNHERLKREIFLLTITTGTEL